MNIKFSLLLATLNRPEILKTCVETLLKQTYCNYEIIIVDQSDKDLCNNSIATMDSKIKYIHINEKGLSHARNVGLQCVTGNYICLIDDDALYDESYLNIAAEMIGNIKPTFLIGLQHDPITYETTTDLNDCKIGWKNVFNGLPSPCMIIETDFLKSVKFDENFGVGSIYGSGEETDVLMNALHQRKTVYFTRRINLYHSTPSIEEIPLQKISNYAYGAGALLRKTAKNYSIFWSCYYMCRTIIGNYILWILQSLKKNYAVAEIRKTRIVYTIKGFLNYNLA